MLSPAPLFTGTNKQSPYQDPILLLDRRPVRDMLIRHIPRREAVHNELLAVLVEAVVDDLSARIAHGPQRLVGHPAESTISDVQKVRADRGLALTETRGRVLRRAAHD